jgi:hypothetical protein
MAWEQVDKNVYGTVEIDGDTSRCQLVERDDDAGLVRVRIIEPGSPAEADDRPGPLIVVAIHSESFTPDDESSRETLPGPD